MTHHLDHGQIPTEREKGNHGCCSSKGSDPSSQHGSGGHGVWMAVACLVPLLVLGGVYLWSSGQSLQWTWLMILLCPLAHLFMMRGGHGGHGDGEKKSVKVSDDEGSKCH